MPLGPTRQGGCGGHAGPGAKRAVLKEGVWSRGSREEGPAGSGQDSEGDGT